MHPLVEQFLAGQMPEPMALTLVGGSMPLPPEALLLAQAHAVWQNTPFAQAARQCVQSMPEGLLTSALANVTRPDVVALLLTHRKEPALLEAGLLHPDFNAEWMERVIPSLPGPVLEIALNNQLFWLERPAILDLLEAHPEGDYYIKRKIQEFRRDVLHQIDPVITSDRLEIIDAVESGQLDKAWSELPLPSADMSPESLAGVESELATAHRLKQPIKDDEGKEVSLTLTQRVMRLRTNQKVILAQKGGKEERTLLIREANRLIQVAVISNPRITESEVTYIAQMRSVHDEVLRLISLHREWMKKYPVVKNLVLNPRTQLTISMNLLKRLQEHDMKLLMRDRNIAELLRREAKRYLDHKSSGGKE